MTKLKKREKKKKADQTGDKGLQECFAYQGSPTTQKFTLNCLSKLTGQLSPATAPGQPQQPPSHSTNAKGSKESNHLKPKGISLLMGRAASTRLCWHSATAQGTEMKPSIPQCYQAAKGTKVPLWYPLEAHALRIHPRWIPGYNKCSPEVHRDHCSTAWAGTEWSEHEALEPKHSKSPNSTAGKNCSCCQSPAPPAPVHPTSVTLSLLPLQPKFLFHSPALQVTSKWQKEWDTHTGDKKHRTKSPGKENIPKLAELSLRSQPQVQTGSLVTKQPLAPALHTTLLSPHLSTATQLPHSLTKAPFSTGFD